MKHLTFALAMLLVATLGSNAQEPVIVEEIPSGIFRTGAQDLSELPKMERDIIILQNVLNDLVANNKDLFYSSSNAKGMYIPGKGVIFNVKYGSRYGNIFFAENMTVIESQNGTTIDLDTDEKDKKQSAEESNKNTENRIEQLSKEFLVNYGSILSELKAGEKVMLNVEYSKLKPVDKDDTGVQVSSPKSNTIYGSAVRLAYSGKSNTHRMSSAINQNDISAFLNGKLSMDQAFSKVSTVVKEDGENDAVDAKIMAGILDDLFQSSQRGKLRRSRKTSWTYFDDFGLMFDMNLSASSATALTFVTRSEDAVIGYAAKEDKDAEKKREEAEKALEENLESVIDMAKESLVTYGRTLRSVKSGEVVILNLNLSGLSSRSKLPKSVRLQVSKAQIEAFSRGQKSLDQLKKEIDIKRLKASNNGNFPATTLGRIVNQGQSVYSNSPARSATTVNGYRTKGQN